MDIFGNSEESILPFWTDDDLEEDGKGILETFYSTVSTITASLSAMI